MTAPQCGAQAFSCWCGRDAGHETPHGCACGGQWTGQGPDMRVVVMPAAPTPDDPMSAVLVEAIGSLVRMTGIPAGTPDPDLARRAGPP